MEKAKNKKSDIKKVKKTLNKISYSDLSVIEIEQELKREKYKSKYVKVLMSTVYTLIIVASVAALIATLVMPVLQISGSSMSPTLHEGEIVISVKSKNFDTGDVIAFYHGNKILVKRVIAESGDWVNITDNGNVYIDEKLLNESYVNKKSNALCVAFNYAFTSSKCSAKNSLIAPSYFSVSTGRSLECAPSSNQTSFFLSCETFS